MMEAYEIEWLRSLAVPLYLTRGNMDCKRVDFYSLNWPEIFEPVLVNLGVHLQWQDDLSAHTLIPALEWVDSMGLLSEFGKGLLGGLRDTQTPRSITKSEATVTNYAKERLFTARSG
jgi:hypothetical protein